MISMPRRKRGQSRWTLLSALATLVIAPSAQTLPAPKNVAYFPVGLGDNAFSPEGYPLDQYFSDTTLTLLKADKRFSFSTFSRTHPGVKRALAEGTIPSALLLPPFTGSANGQFKAITLGKLVRADFAMAGIIDKFTFSERNKSADMNVTVQLFDLKLSKVAGIVAFTVKGTGATRVEAAKACVTEAAKQASTQSLQILSAPPKPPAGGG